MCLHTIDDKPKRKWGVGYKILRMVFNEEKRGDDNLYHGAIGGYTELAKLNTWTTAVVNVDIVVKREEGKGIQRYKSGYHLFPTLRAVKDWLNYTMCGAEIEYGVICKVRFRNVVATGTQDGMPVIVAKEIKVLREVRKEVRKW